MGETDIGANAVVLDNLVKLTVSFGEPSFFEVLKAELKKEKHITGVECVASSQNNLDTEVCTTMLGLTHKLLINEKLLNSLEFVTAKNVFSELNQKVKLPAKVLVSGSKKVFDDHIKLLDWIIESNKKNYYIQRYKGLGEMNPDQLWSTTLNPENRSLVQIEVGEAVQADEMFSLLMGERVEPRREFIEKHATEVLELDV